MIAKIYYSLASAFFLCFCLFFLGMFGLALQNIFFNPPEVMLRCEDGGLISSHVKMDNKTEIALIKACESLAY